MTNADSARELAWIRNRLDQPLGPTAGAAVIATTLQGVVAHWNAAAEQLYGWTAEQALGRNILDLTPATHTRDQSAQILSALQAGKAWSGEIQLRHRDGSPVLAYVLDLPVGDFDTPQGAIVGVSVTSQMGSNLARRAREIRAAVNARFAAYAPRPQARTSST